MFLKLYSVKCHELRYQNQLALHLVQRRDDFRKSTETVKDD